MNLKYSKIIECIWRIYKDRKQIPLHEPSFFGNEKKYLNNVIDSGFVSSVGKYVNELEEKIEKINNSKKAIAVINGTSGLHTSLLLAGVNNGDDVITQALTFVATSNAIKYLNANPIYLDVDFDTMGLSPNSLSNFLNEYGDLRDDGCYNKISGNKISACLPMHTFGFMARIDMISKICKKWNIPVIEDSAEAFGSSYKGIKSGNFGLFSVFSFNGNKIITSGGGGIITTNKIKLGNIAKHVTTTAKKKHEWDYYHNMLGYNYRMPNVNAALALAQIENIDKLIESKSEVYKEYNYLLNKMGLRLKEIPNNTKWNYWLMSIEFENEKEKNLFLKYSNKEKIFSRPIWELMFRLPMYKNSFRDSQNNAISLQKRIVNLPSSARIS